MLSIWSLNPFWNLELSCVKCELKFDLLIGFDHWFEDNMEWSAMVDLEKVDHALNDLIQKMLIFLSLFKVLERLN
jgi:hypothetical protein